LQDEPLVVCHNDLNAANIIYDETTESFTFIDYEQVGMNYRAFDIADHYCEFAGLHLDVEQFPSKEKQFLFFEHYIGNTSEKELERLYTQVCKFVLVAHLLWFIWAKLQDCVSKVNFDYNVYAEKRIREYWRRKEEYLNFKSG